MPEQGESGTTFTWRDVRDLALLLPALHLAFCFIFLTFYSLAYGSAIEVFYAPSDIFHVSFRDIAPGYVALAAMIFITLLFRRGSRKPSAGNGVDGQAAAGRPRLLLVMAVTSYVLAAVSVIIASIYYKITGHLAISAVVSFALGLTVIYLRAQHLKNLDNLWPMAILTLLFPIFVSAYSGAQSAEQDEFLTYARLQRNSPSCGNFAVIRNIGEYYMAVGKDGRRAMIDEDCKPRFNLPPPRLAR